MVWVKWWISKRFYGTKLRCVYCFTVLGNNTEYTEINGTYEWTVPIVGHPTDGADSGNKDFDRDQLIKWIAADFVKV